MTNWYNLGYRNINLTPGFYTPGLFFWSSFFGSIFYRELRIAMFQVFFLGMIREGSHLCCASKSRLRSLLASWSWYQKKIPDHFLYSRSLLILRKPFLPDLVCLRISVLWWTLPLLPLPPVCSLFHLKAYLQDLPQLK